MLSAHTIKKKLYLLHTVFTNGHIAIPIGQHAPDLNVDPAQLLIGQVAFRTILKLLKPGFIYVRIDHLIVPKIEYNIPPFKRIIKIEILIRFAVVRFKFAPPSDTFFTGSFFFSVLYYHSYRSSQYPENQRCKIKV